jgi:5'-3' exonuclease
MNCMKHQSRQNKSSFLALNSFHLLYRPLKCLALAYTGTQNEKTITMQMEAAIKMSSVRN